MRRHVSYSIASAILSGYALTTSPLFTPKVVHVSAFNYTFVILHISCSPHLSVVVLVVHTPEIKKEFKMAGWFVSNNLSSSFTTTMVKSFKKKLLQLVCNYQHLYDISVPLHTGKQTLQNSFPFRAVHTVHTSWTTQSTLAELSLELRLESERWLLKWKGWLDHNLHPSGWILQIHTK